MRYLLIIVLVVFSVFLPVQAEPLKGNVEFIDDAQAVNQYAKEILASVPKKLDVNFITPEEAQYNYKFKLQNSRAEGFRFMSFDWPGSTDIRHGVDDQNKGIILHYSFNRYAISHQGLFLVEVYKPGQDYTLQYSYPKKKLTGISILKDSVAYQYNIKGRLTHTLYLGNKTSVAYKKNGKEYYTREEMNYHY